MIIYIDVLIFVNYIIDFLLIRLSLRFSKTTVSFKRLILASVICSLFSLYIFIPKINIVAEILLRLIPVFVTSLICNKFIINKNLVRIIIYFFGVSFIFAGAMAGLWMLFKPRFMALNNGAVYFNVSPVVLIALSFLFYLIIIILQRISKRDFDSAKYVEVELNFCGIIIKSTALVDTGFSLKGDLSDKTVIMINISLSNLFLGEDEANLLTHFKTPQNEKLTTRIKFMQVKTASGVKLMPALKLDKLIIDNEKVYSNVIAVISEELSFEDFKVILPSDII